MTHTLIRTPSLFIKSGEEDTGKFALMLTLAKRRVVVRLTGGCGGMSTDDVAGLYRLFTKSFSGFDGAMLFGGTRMVKKDDHSQVVPGITEIGPLIRRENKDAVVMGIVPRIHDLAVAPELGLVVSREDGNDYITIIHPDQDACLLVQRSADQEAIWDAEYVECLRITDLLRTYAGDWKSILIAYNGGSVTEKEIRATADRQWPVILIAGSGRVCDQLAQDELFLQTHPSVMVVEKSVESLRACLVSLGVVADTQTMTITSKNHVA